MVRRPVVRDRRRSGPIRYTPASGRVAEAVQLAQEAPAEGGGGLRGAEAALGDQPVELPACERAVAEQVLVGDVGDRLGAVDRYRRRAHLLDLGRAVADVRADLRAP